MAAERYGPLSLRSTEVLIAGTSQEDGVHDGMDILQPYLHHRTQRDTHGVCQPVKYGNVTHSLHKAFDNNTENTPPIHSYWLTKEMGHTYWNKKTLFVLHQVLTDPLSTLSIKESGYLGSCLNESGTRATVRETARQHSCVYASNAGYFNTHDGRCLGNVVSDGKYVHNSRGILNAHFGITGDGQLFTGYLSELNFLRQGFKQLVGGVIWLVKDGESYVDQSKKVECSDTEETGTLDRFVDVISARTAIGHDALGRVHIVQVNGKTDLAGVNLHEFAEMLIELGVTNAVNLDGGGSATSILNDTLINFPSDKCHDKINDCERAVSTIVCVHYPACTVPDCSNHGACVEGKCQCRHPWVGEGCEMVDELRCGPHGSWANDGCDCISGWTGANCSKLCPPGWYGRNCASRCLCGDHGDCHVETGSCSCHAGYAGKFCQKKCPYGFYGLNCVGVCFCQDSCFCDHVSGSCNITRIHSDYLKAGDCLVQQAIKKDHLVPDGHEQYSLCISSVACLCVIATASLILNAVFTYLLVSLKRDNALLYHQRNSNSNNKDNNNSDDMESIELGSLSSTAPLKSRQDKNKKTKRFKRRKKRPRDRVFEGNQYRALMNGGVVGSSGVGAGAAGKLTTKSFFGLSRKKEAVAQRGNRGEGVGDETYEEEEKYNDDNFGDDDVSTVTGSGEDENDSFLSRKSPCT